MITVESLVKRADYSPTLHDMKFWELSASDITKAHLQGFYYRASIKSNKQEAKELSLRIANAISEASYAGAIFNNSLSRFTIKDEPMLSGELRMQLEHLPLSHRRCVFFSLLMNWQLEQSINLTWSEVKTYSKLGLISDLALDVIHSMPRHFKFENVFWEDDSHGRPVQLENVRAELELVFGYGFDILLKRFQGMVISDPQLYSEEVTEQFSRGHIHDS